MKTITGLTITTVSVFIGTCALSYQSGRHAGWREGFMQGRSTVDAARAEAYTAGYNKARHDVALVWYRQCWWEAGEADAETYKTHAPKWCGVQGGEMKLNLGFEDRWPDEMP